MFFPMSICQLNSMFKTLFQAMVQGASPYYGDCIGLSPIALAKPMKEQKNLPESSNFWIKECFDNPSSMACLNYEL